MASLKPIGFIRTPFQDKFGIPRQANLLNSISAKIELIPPYNDSKAFKGIEAFSHLWLTFGFHKNDQQWRPLIRPPRLGGNEKIGVFASRSSFRPNGIGQSLVSLRSITVRNNQAELLISCPDVMDGTPLFDIKPYIEYADYPGQNLCSYASNAPEKTLKVELAENCSTILRELQAKEPALKATIEEIIAYDPRPAYKQNSKDNKVYKLRLYQFEVSFQVKDSIAKVTEIKPAS